MNVATSLKKTASGVDNKLKPIYSATETSLNHDLLENPKLAS